MEKEKQEFQKPEELYRYENGQLYIPPAKEPPPFVPDQGFDGPA